MKFAGRLTGKSEAVDRLLGSLVVDSSKIRRELGWTPPYTMEQGLKETGEWFKRQNIGDGLWVRGYEKRVMGERL